MKTILHLRTSLYLCAILLSFAACGTDELPAPPESPETPAEAPDAWHDKIREKPYPKADNEIYINPAPLLVPQTMKTGTHLQFSLSRQADFSGSAVIFSSPKPWCMYNPHKSLENGTWYWRFRSVDMNGHTQPWSETYQFEIKAETPRFATPSFDYFLNRAPRTHPRLFCFLDDKAEQTRHNITSHPEYRQLTGRAATAATAVKGYAQLANPYDKASDIKVSVQHLYQAYYLLQDQAYADKLYEMLTILLSHPVSDSQLFASNFGATDIAISYLKIYDILYQRLTPQEKTSIEEVLMRVSRYYFKVNCGMQENHIFDNHFWQHNMRILFQTAFALYDKSVYAGEVLPMLEYYYELWTARAPASGFNRDGVWHNGAGYFNANVKTLYYMPSLLSHITGSNFLKHPWYQHVGKALIYTWPPESKSAGFGDESEKGSEPNRLRVAFADFIARETGDSYAGWYSNQCRESLVQDYELRLYRMVNNRTYTTDLPDGYDKMIWYKDAGEVVMHSNLAHTDQNLSVSFRSSTFGSGSHTVANQNGFNVLYKGEDIYRSAGYYLNFSDAHNLMSYRHTRAHNTILVDGIGQPYSMKGYGNITRALGGKHISYCLGDASRAYCGISEDPMWIDAFRKAGIAQTPVNGFGVTPLTKFRRHLLLLHPHTIVIYDELEASHPVRWDWLLHSPTPFRITQSARSMTTTNDTKGFSSVAHLFSNRDCSISQTDQFVVPPTAIPDPNYPNQWHLSAGFPPSVQNRILVIIQVSPNGTTPSTITRNGNVFLSDEWRIEANLEYSQAASLVIRNRTNGAAFSYGSDKSLPGNEQYQRKYPDSSLLYDESNGSKQIQEMRDYTPASTRTVLY